MRYGLLVALLLAVAPAVADEEPPYPPGKSSQEFAGLKFFLITPPEWDPEKEHSLLVALHGMGASAESIASWFEVLADEEFVICAPRSTGNAWMKPDTDKVKKIVAHLVKCYRVGKGRLHGTGFSNGGAHLGSVVFDPELPFATACWMGSGFTGGRVPKRAKKEMAVLALAGAQDPARGAAEGTPKILSGKVRYAECRIQENLGHEIPDKLIPYLHTFMKAMEGRFHPGQDQSFLWVDDLEVGREEIAEKKTPGFLYFFDERVPENEDARRVELEVFFDPRVRFYGGQLVPVKVDVEIEPEYFASLGFTRTPAFVFLNADGTVAGKLEGNVTAEALAKELRKLAPKKRMPR